VPPKPETFLPKNVQAFGFEAATRWFGVPRLRGSDSPPGLLDSRITGKEPAAPEDFQTRLKAELRTTAHSSTVVAVLVLRPL
jgi:hypothetical protein